MRTHPQACCVAIREIRGHPGSEMARPRNEVGLDKRKSRACPQPLSLDAEIERVDIDVSQRDGREVLQEFVELEVIAVSCAKHQQRGAD